jgi:hypothetical protein
MSTPPDSDAKECPLCKKKVLDLLRIDTGMKVALEHVSYTGQIPANACASCYQNLTSLISQGAKLRAQKIAKEENKRIVWRQRIELAKRARQEMSLKNFANAAVFYEKYLNSLAAGFEVDANHLVPSLFADTKFKKELMVVAFAYFDLFKIYDHSSNSSQAKFAHMKEQLKLFANLPITRPPILRKLRNYKGSALHKNIVDEVIRAVDRNKDSRCFIATAAFESTNCSEMQIFYFFRDHVLCRSQMGQAIVNRYYLISPAPARYIAKKPILKKITRFILRVVAFSLRFTLNLKSHP